MKKYEYLEIDYTAKGVVVSDFMSCHQIAHIS